LGILNTQGIIQCSLKADFERVAEQVPQELGHSLDLHEVVVVHIEVVPGRVEVLLQPVTALRLGGHEMGGNHFFRGSESCVLIKEEMAGGLSLVVLHLKSVVLDKRVHQAVVSLFLEPLGNGSLVASLGTSSVEVGQEVLEILGLEEQIVGGIELGVGPVVVKVRREGGIGVGVPRHGSSDIGLRVLAGLEVGPVIMKMARERGIGMSISRHGATDVGLRVLAGLQVGPIVVEVAAESRVRVSISWHRASNVWLRVLIGLDVSPVVVKVAAESGIGVGVPGHGATNIRLGILTSLEMGPVVMEVA